jgi:hypothetical protein
MKNYVQEFIVFLVLGFLTSTEQLTVFGDCNGYNNKQ